MCTFSTNSDNKYQKLWKWKKISKYKWTLFYFFYFMNRWIEREVSPQHQDLFRRPRPLSFTGSAHRRLRPSSPGRTPPPLHHPLLISLTNHSASFRSHPSDYTSISPLRLPEPRLWTGTRTKDGEGEEAAADKQARAQGAQRSSMAARVTIW